LDGSSIYSLTLTSFAVPSVHIVQNHTQYMQMVGSKIMGIGKGLEN